MFEWIADAITWIAMIIVVVIIAIALVVVRIVGNDPVGKYTAGVQSARNRFLTFNIEYEASGYSPADVVEIIDSVGADVAVLNEAHPVEGHVTSEREGAIADALDLAGINHVRSHDWAIIASRGVITQPYSTSTNKYLQTAALIDDKYFVVSVHLTDFPYQPYQLAKIPYCASTDMCQKFICGGGSANVGANVSTDMNTDTTHPICPEAESQMIVEAQHARGEEVTAIIVAVETLRKSGKPVFIAGDFNEPSHLDWTDEAVAAGQKPLRVRYPTSAMLAEAGLRDLFREVHPDPVANPGYTWPARMPTDVGDVAPEHMPEDRIDFIYAAGDVSAHDANVIVTPSDHRAVVVEWQ